MAKVYSAVGNKTTTARRHEGKQKQKITDFADSADLRRDFFPHLRNLLNLRLPVLERV
jgi:hypothetical protein